MLQLLLHLIGDYLTQNDWMAKNKTKHLYAAVIHGLVYSIPFLVLLNISWVAFSVICISHILIDRYRLARYVIFAKNWLFEPSIKWADCNLTGYSNRMPEFMSFWLMIIADQTLHLTINYAAISWL